MRCCRRRDVGVYCLLLLAGIASFSSVARAQEEVQGEDAQEVTAVFSGSEAGYENEADDM